MFRQAGADYFNPDEATARILAANPDISTAEANSAAWHEGKRLLERAIAERLDFAFETTLGGHTISALLHEALAAGIEVRMWFVGLSSPELHIARVRSRVARGGHDIPEEKIRERYDRSRINLIELMPRLTELRVFDNSFDADPHAGHSPAADPHSSPCEGEDPGDGRVVQNASVGQALGGRSGQDLQMITLTLRDVFDHRSICCRGKPALTLCSWSVNAFRSDCAFSLKYLWSGASHASSSSATAMRRSPRISVRDVCSARWPA